MKREVGTRIQFARKRLGISQKQMIADLDYSRSTVAFVETNRNLPSLEALEKYCEYLHVPYQFLLDSSIPMTNERIDFLNKILSLSDEDISWIDRYIDLYLEIKNRT